MIHVFRNPVITPDGWLYDKEVILKYILEKKAEYQRKLKAYEAQVESDQILYKFY